MCSFVRVLPIPSTVVTAKPCNEQSGARHEFTVMCLSDNSQRQQRDEILVRKHSMDVAEFHLFRHETTSTSILAQEKVVLSRLSDSTARKLVTTSTTGTTRKTRVRGRREAHSVDWGVQNSFLRCNSRARKTKLVYTPTLLLRRRPPC